MINSGLLEMGHARALLSLSSEQQINIAELIVSKSLSVRETEKLVQRIHISRQKQENFIEFPLGRKKQEWNAWLSKEFSLKVNVRVRANGKGRVIIHFDSVEEADWLMNHLSISETQE